MNTEILSFLKTIAPGIATALGGPLAGMATGWLASKLGVDPEKVQQTIAGMTPADMIKMKELDLDFQKFMAENGIKIDLAQIEVNKEEAKSENILVAGWRPAVGWIGAFGLAYAAILEPFMRFIAQVAFSYTGKFPTIDSMLTLQVLMGILGLGAMRSFDKKWGNGSEAGKH